MNRDLKERGDGGGERQVSQHVVDPNRDGVFLLDLMTKEKARQVLHDLGSAGPQERNVYYKRCVAC